MTNGGYNVHNEERLLITDVVSYVVWARLLHVKEFQLSCCY